MCDLRSEKYNQELQRTLTSRERALGRVSQRPSSAHQNSGCDHFFGEPLEWYKKLEPYRSEWPNLVKWYHPKHGIRVVDQETIIAPSRDRLSRTQHGLLRSSTGDVVYSSRHRMKFELDAHDLLRILRKVGPYSSSAWSLENLEDTFLKHHGRHGSWERYNMQLKIFLSLFPKTFVVFGTNGEFVRPIHKTLQCVVDKGEDVMVRLALAREKGYIENSTPVAGSTGMENQYVPELQHVRAKTLYRPRSAPQLRHR
eukprot:gnl/TRDRNA2_/TRDRNA2_28624_c0_seq1.p1 gnl/TRDRNA2_/TRDRNA2_28624_c0~~gnl/TRDRNA2_/TRDRNA2_28624_c0_seq1.p1  ORF type:complete len:255 (+),score=28.10 gnl/TRDRNA2_/TRDRNA2_28624_c0_seq1:55-819(+)